MEGSLISLTKLDNARILVNLETIKYVETMPDTVVRFVNGDSVIVRESLEEVEQRVIKFKKQVLEANAAHS